MNSLFKAIHTWLSECNCYVLYYNKCIAFSESHNYNNGIDAASCKVKFSVLCLSIISEFLRHILIPPQCSDVLLPSLTLVLCLMSHCQRGPELAFSTMLGFNGQYTFYSLLISSILMCLSQCVAVHQLNSTHLCDLLYNDPSGVNACHT